MFSIVLILSCSIVLFAYWFRYSCLLILQTRTREANLGRHPGLIVSTDRRIAPDAEESLERTHRELTDEYRMLRFLLAQANDLNVDPIERRMLLLDYQLMRIWYQLTRRISETQARGALDEMATIVNFFSQSLNQAQPRRVRV